MSIKLPAHTQRMLDLMEYCIQTKQCSSKKDFMESIGFPIGNLSAVRAGIRGFTIEQFITAAKKYSINMNWLSGISTDMHLPKPMKPIDKLKAAVKEIELGMKK